MRNADLKHIAQSDSMQGKDLILEWQTKVVFGDTPNDKGSLNLVHQLRFKLLKLRESQRQVGEWREIHRSELREPD